MKKTTALIELARPSHWLKNLLVFAALLFSQKYNQTEMWLRAIVAFVEFCLLSSGAYALNDILDRKTDAMHPRARRRPIPSGRLGIGAASIWGMLLLAGGLVLAGWLGRRAVIVAAAYLMLNALYNVAFRRQAIIDVVAIAMGFVLRAIAGGVAIGVPVSAWLIVCTFMLCVFLALIKRRSDVVLLDKRTARSTRSVHAFYTPAKLDHMLGVSAGLAIIAYTFYCLVGPHSPGVHMVWTVPIVLYGMFRLYSLAVGSAPAGPVMLIRRDPVMWLVAIIWVAVIVAVMQFSHLRQLQGWITP